MEDKFHPGTFPLVLQWSREKSSTQEPLVFNLCRLVNCNYTVYLRQASQNNFFCPQQEIGTKPRSTWSQKQRKAAYLTLRGDSTERPRRAQASLVKMSQMSAHWFASRRWTYGEFSMPCRRYTRLPIRTWMSGRNQEQQSLYNKQRDCVSSWSFHMENRPIHRITAHILTSTQTITAMTARRAPLLLFFWLGSCQGVLPGNLLLAGLLFCKLSDTHSTLKK